jgi:hypothetical protein
VGNARARGTYEERVAQAIAAGRFQPSRIRRLNQRELDRHNKAAAALRAAQAAQVQQEAKE